MWFAMKQRGEADWLVLWDLYMCWVRWTHLTSRLGGTISEKIFGT